MRFLLGDEEQLELFAVLHGAARSKELLNTAVSQR